MQIGKAASDLCSSSISQHFVSAYFASGPWEDYVRSLVEIYRRRRDVMLDALAEHFPREAEWTRPQGGLFIWATLPDYIDTTDLLARALREQVAFVPGRAAYVDGRGAASVREQVAMFGTLTGRHPPAEPSRAARRDDAAAPELRDPAPEELAPVLRLRAKRERAG
jgi:2-aminoadipate transaminase